MILDTKIEDRYLKLLMDPLERCAEYKPKLGSSDKRGVDWEGFKTLYGEDPFYHWVGLDDELMYAAHKAAGGMTSVYRQLGQGCERLFRAVVRDSLGLSEEDVSWKYEITKRDGSKGGPHAGRPNRSRPDSRSPRAADENAGVAGSQCAIPELSENERPRVSRRRY